MAGLLLMVGQQAAEVRKAPLPKSAREGQSTRKESATRAALQNRTCQMLGVSA
jgi:hypothetical protein